MAELVVWGIPLVVWAVLGVVVTGSIGLWRFAADLVPLLLVLTTPVLLIILGWRLSLDPTPMRAIRRFARWLPWTLGLAAALSYGSTLIDASSLVVLGVVAMGYPAVLVAVVCNRRLMDRMPFVHIIATAMAARSIRRSREIVRAAKRAVRRSERERKDVALTVGG